MVGLPSSFKFIVWHSIFFYLLQIYDFTAEDLQDIGEIGRGNFGTVNKMLHEKSHKVMAVKVGWRLLATFSLQYTNQNL